MSDRKEIIDLTAQDTVAANDLFPIWSGRNQDTRRVTGAGILAYVVANSSANGLVKQYYAPGISFTVAVTSTTASIWLLITPVGAIGSAVIQLPGLGAAFDGQEVLITSTGAFATLTVQASNLTVAGAPGVLATNGFLRFKFDQPTLTWYRIG